MQSAICDSLAELEVPVEETRSASPALTGPQRLFAFIKNASQSPRVRQWRGCSLIWFLARRHRSNLREPQAANNKILFDQPMSFEKHKSCQENIAMLGMQSRFKKKEARGTHCKSGQYVSTSSNSKADYRPQAETREEYSLHE